MIRFHRWFIEPVVMLRGYFYLAVGFGLLEAVRIVGWLL